MYIINEIRFQDNKTPISRILGVVKTKALASEIIKKESEGVIFGEKCFDANDDDILKEVIKEKNYIMCILNIRDTQIIYNATKIDDLDLFKNNYFVATVEGNDYTEFGNTYLKQEDAEKELDSFIKNKINDLLSKNINFDLANTNDENGIKHRMIFLENDLENDQAIDFYIKVQCNKNNK